MQDTKPRPTRPPLKPLSEDAREKVERAMNACGKEGYAIWGFLFANQPAIERLTADGTDFIQFEIFNNAGEDSVPMFIYKTEQALVVLRSNMPLGTSINEQFSKVLSETGKEQAFTNLSQFNSDTKQ